MSDLSQLGSLDLTAPDDTRATELELLCGAVVHLVDSALGHAQRRAIRRFLLEVTWTESGGALERPHEGRIGLFGLSPSMAQTAVRSAQQQGQVQMLATLSGLTPDQLGQAADALSGVTDWPVDNDLFTALMTSDPFAALAARCFILTLPGAIPQDQEGRARYWAQQYHPDSVTTEDDLTAVFLAGAQAVDSLAPPTLHLSGVTVVASPTQRALPYRQATIGCVVLHTTGDTDWTKILRFYDGAQGFQPHYAIEQDGTVHQIVDEDVVAFHVGLSRVEQGYYAQGYAAWSKVHAQHDDATDAWTYTVTGAELSNYHTWRDTWHTQGIESPLDLPTGAVPNAASVGIELQAPTDVERTADIFSDAQYAALTVLLASVAARNGIALDRSHVLGHYDANPFNRSNAHGGWDPGEAFNWSRAVDGANAIVP